VPQEYWEIEAKLRKKAATANNEFVAKLEKIDDKKVEIKNKEEADGIVEALKGKEFRVVEVKLTEKKRNAEPPFITSTMQQEAFNKLKYNTTKTMIVAQQLYEGIDIGEENPVGLITYMRTDSVHVSAEAIKEVRNHIQERFGNDYLPEKPNTYKVKKLAQEAHEAIRPTLITRPAESVREFLTDEQYELYELIYNRFLASQMSPARFQVTSVDIKADGYHFGASGSKLVFNGFMAAYDIEEKEEKEKEKKFIPALEKDELLDLSELLPSQHFTKAPPRYSDSSLVKALEEDGIGRPSTYAPIISTLILRDYIRRLKGYFTPTELGFKVCDMLIEYFPKVMDINFTAAMEEELDEVEEGRLGKIKVLQDFYAPFKTSLEYAQANIKKEVIVSDQICDKCGKSMIVKWGRKGKFLSCSGFPACKNAKSITSGVKCPEPGCGGELIERRSRRGFFYGCSKFPTCRYTSRALPQSNDEG
jgi:DNA topoisomerase-1